MRTMPKVIKTDIREPSHINLPAVSVDVWRLGVVALVRRDLTAEEVAARKNW